MEKPSSPNKTATPGVTDKEKEGRPRREAQVTDFKKYHTSGTTGTSPQPGKVAAAIQRLETPEKDKDNAPPATQATAPKAKRNISGTKSTTPCNQATQHSHTLNIHQESSTFPSDMSELEQLKQELQQQRELNEKIKNELEGARLRAQLQDEKRKQQEWEAAKNKLELEQELAESKHQAAMEVYKAKEPAKESATGNKPQGEESSIEYLKKKLSELTGTPVEDIIRPKPEEEESSRKQQVADKLKDLMKQQQEIAQTARLAAQDCQSDPRIAEMLQKLQALEPLTTKTEKSTEDQAKVLEQLMASLQGKEAESAITKQKDILKQFLVDANKVSTTGGVTTLKPQLLKKLTGESDTFDMTQWLAKFNRQSHEEGRCDSCQEECKHHKKSGMLDKATTNIQHKEIWPQKNLLEDWADEDMEFRHMQFEHYVAGESRTIEMGTEPAQILGRLRLLRRMAYAKLRGYEWPLIRKMYAAILRSIETKEHTWDSNFDRFEAILYRRAPQQP